MTTEATLAIAARGGVKLTSARRCYDLSSAMDRHVHRAESAIGVCHQKEAEDKHYGVDPQRLLFSLAHLTDVSTRKPSSACQHSRANL